MIKEILAHGHGLNSIFSIKGVVLKAKTWESDGLEFWLLHLPAIVAWQKLFCYPNISSPSNLQWLPVVQRIASESIFTSKSLNN